MLPWNSAISQCNWNRYHSIIVKQHLQQLHYLYEWTHFFMCVIKTSWISYSVNCIISYSLNYWKNCLVFSLESSFKNSHQPHVSSVGLWFLVGCRFPVPSSYMVKTVVAFLWRFSHFIVWLTVALVVIMLMSKGQYVVWPVVLTDTIVINRNVKILYLLRSCYSFSCNSSHSFSLQSKISGIIGGKAFIL